MNEVKQVVKKDKKIFQKLVSVGISKVGNRYFYIRDEQNKIVFVNLIKDKKRYQPSLPSGVTEVEVSYSSYAQDEGQLALFDVSKVTIINTK